MAVLIGGRVTLDVGLRFVWRALAGVMIVEFGLIPAAAAAAAAEVSVTNGVVNSSSRTTLFGSSFMRFA